MFVEPCYTLTVNLHNFQRTRFLHQILRHHAHTRPHFQHRKFRTGVHRVGYCLRYREVSQEMLTKVLLRSYLFHRLLYNEWNTKTQRHKVILCAALCIFVSLCSVINICTFFSKSLLQRYEIFDLVKVFIRDNPKKGGFFVLIFRSFILSLQTLSNL